MEMVIDQVLILRVEYLTLPVASVHDTRYQPVPWQSLAPISPPYQASNYQNGE